METAELKILVFTGYKKSIIKKLFPGQDQWIGSDDKSFFQALEDIVEIFEITSEKLVKIMELYDYDPTYEFIKKGDFTTKILNHIVYSSLPDNELWKRTVLVRKLNFLTPYSDEIRYKVSLSNKSRVVSMFEDKQGEDLAITISNYLEDEETYEKLVELKKRLNK